MTTVKTFSSADTRLFGKQFAKKNLKLKTKNLKLKGALVIALSGDLGAGKTTFVQGFFEGLGIKKRATSPTFIIMRRTALPQKKVSSQKFQVKNVYHMDAYRIKHPKELAVLEFKNILSNPKNILLIEWAENIQKALPKGALRLKFKHGEKEHEREIIF